MDIIYDLNPVRFISEAGTNKLTNLEHDTPTRPTSDEVKSWGLEYLPCKSVDESRAIQLQKYGINLIDEIKNHDICHTVFVLEHGIYQFGFVQKELNGFIFANNVNHSHFFVGRLNIKHEKEILKEIAQSLNCLVIRDKKLSRFTNLGQEHTKAVQQRKNLFDYYSPFLESQT